MLRRNHKTNEVSFDYMEFPQVIANLLNSKINPHIPSHVYTSHEIKETYPAFFLDNLPGDILRFFSWDENTIQTEGYEIIRNSIVIKNVIVDVK